MNELLTVNVQIIQLRDPRWVAVRDSTGKALNMDRYYVSPYLDVEVLTVHFNKRTMRVRFVWNGETQTRDISADAFFEKYAVVLNIPKDESSDE